MQPERTVAIPLVNEAKCRFQVYSIRERRLKQCVFAWTALHGDMRVCRSHWLLLERREEERERIMRVPVTPRVDNNRRDTAEILDAAAAVADSTDHESEV